MHTHIHTCIHTYTHAYIHTHIRTDTNIHTYIHAYIHTHMHTYTHTCTHTDRHTYIHYIHMYVCVCVLNIILKFICNKKYIRICPISTEISLRICWVDEFHRVPSHVAENGTADHSQHEHEEEDATQDVCTRPETSKQYSINHRMSVHDLKHPNSTASITGCLYTT